MIIGRNRESVVDAMSIVREYIRRDHKSKEMIEIIGLVNSSNFDGYTMVLDEADDDASVFFACDRVAKFLEHGNDEPMSAQVLTGSKRKHDDIQGP